MLTVFIGRHRPVSLSLPLALPLALPLPLQRPSGVGTGLPGQVHAGLVVEADPVRLPPGAPDDHPAQLPEAQGGPVEHRVLGVVLEAVVDDETKVALERLKSQVAVGFQKVPHGLEVHGGVDVVQVVRHLQPQRAKPVLPPMPESPGVSRDAARLKKNAKRGDGRRVPAGRALDGEPARRLTSARGTGSVKKLLVSRSCNWSSVLLSSTRRGVSCISSAICCILI